MNDWEPRVLNLEGMTILVPAVDYPWITEWDWEVDAEKQVTRLHHGARVNLYHEILKRHMDDDVFYVLSGHQVEGVFGQEPEYQELIVGWAERVARAEELGFMPPHVLELVSCAVSAALHHFYEWVREGLIFTFRPDPDGLTPGSIHKRRMRQYPRCERISDFLTEYTGDWQEDEEAATGEIPMQFNDVLAYTIIQTMNLLLLHENGEDTDLTAVWATFKEAGLPLGAIGANVHRLVSKYPIPQVQIALI